MPLYRNECLACGHCFRTLEPRGSTDHAACPACGGRETRRLLPHTAVHFKGSGYYRTDHGRRGNDTKEEHDGPREPSAASSDTKPEK